MAVNGAGAGLRSCCWVRVGSHTAGQGWLGLAGSGSEAGPMRRGAG